MRNGAQLHGDSKQDEHATQERDEQFCQCFKCFVRTTPIRFPTPVIVSQFSSIYYLISFEYIQVVTHDLVVAIWILKWQLKFRAIFKLRAVLVVNRHQVLVVVGHGGKSNRVV